MIKSPPDIWFTVCIGKVTTDDNGAEHQEIYSSQSALLTLIEPTPLQKITQAMQFLFMQALAKALSNYNTPKENGRGSNLN